MTQTLHVTFILSAVAICSWLGLYETPTAAEVDGGNPPAQMQPAKDSPAKETTNGGGEARKETREIEEQPNRLDVLKLERDLLQSKADDLQRQLETAQQDLASGRKILADLNGRVAALEKEKGQIAASLTEARDQARDLATKLAAEQVKSATLREDKQRLMSGTTTAKEEIARLQKRAGELETEAARTEDLNKRLAERDTEIERLRKASADRENLAGKVSALTDKLERTKQRVATLTEELAARSEEAARARQERDQFAADMRRQQDSGKEESSAVSVRLSGRTESAVAGEPDLSQDKSKQDQAKLDIVPLPLPVEERRALQESGKISPNGLDPKVMKDTSGFRLTSAHTALTKSFEVDIARGDLNVSNARDHLTITLADRALFEPGQSQIKPDGLKLLKRVGDALKALPDKHVRLESHLNDLSAAPNKDRVPGNWELSLTRTTRIGQHLLDEGAVDSNNFSISLFPDTRPVGNGEEEGRPVRHTEIILYPKSDH
jgi:chemotaxis protein MotB